MKKNKFDKENSKLEETEDTTKYGEFVSSYFAWITLEEQKKKANELDKMTQKKKHK